MAVRLHENLSKKNTIREALDDITQTRWHSVRSYGPEYAYFYDVLVKYLCEENVFHLAEKVTRVGSINVYVVRGRGVRLRDVSDNFLVRLLYDLTMIPVRSFPVFGTLRMMNVKIPNQVLCCAAGIKECLDLSSGYTNMSRGRFSWFKLLLGMGFSIQETSGEMIKDDYGNSIIDIVTDWNVINLLRELVLQKVTRIQMLPSTEKRFQALAKTSNSVRRNLSALEIESI